MNRVDIERWNIERRESFAGFLALALSCIIVATGILCAIIALAGCSAALDMSVARGVTSALQAELPVASQLVATLPPSQGRTDAQSTIAAAVVTLPAANTALASYAAAPSGSTLCTVKAALGLVASALTAVGDGLVAIGVEVPAAILIALGAIGGVIDGMLGCTPPPATPLAVSLVSHFAALHPTMPLQSGSHAP